MIAIPALTMMTWLKIGASAAVVAFAVTSCVMRDTRIATQAVQKDRAVTEKANKNAASKGKRAADRSIDPGVRGQLDPSTRD